jgi:hypothetical protein
MKVSRAVRNSPGSDTSKISWGFIEDFWLSDLSGLDIENLPRVQDIVRVELALNPAH